MSDPNVKPLRLLYLITQLFMLGIGQVLVGYNLGFLPEFTRFLPVVYVILFSFFYLVLPAAQFFGGPAWAMEAGSKSRRAAIFLWIANLAALWLGLAASLTLSNRESARSKTTYVWDPIGTIIAGLASLIGNRFGAACSVTQQVFG